MAIRIIRTDGDPILRKKSKIVTKFDDKLYELIDDMIDTMEKNDGVGIAAVQVGVLKRVIVIDPIYEEGEVAEDVEASEEAKNKSIENDKKFKENADKEPDYQVLINPEIIDSLGEKEDYEGCLSIPGRLGLVNRPTYIKVKYQDEDGEEQIIEAYNFHARELCHEIDHLNGILYKDIMIGDYAK